jgi:hypothetical protein
VARLDWLAGDPSCRDGDALPVSISSGLRPECRCQWGGGSIRAVSGVAGVAGDRGGRLPGLAIHIAVEPTPAVCRLGGYRRINSVADCGVRRRLIGETPWVADSREIRRLLMA